MTKYTCPEKAIGDYTHVITDADSVLFPHVDTCVAIALRIGTGWHVGHAALRYVEPFFDGDAVAQLNDLITQNGTIPGNVDEMFAYGGAEWNGALDGLVAKCRCATYKRITNEVDGGADVTIDFSTGRISVKATETSAQLLGTTLAALPDRSHVRYTKPLFYRLAGMVKSQFRADPLPAPAEFFAPDFDGDEDGIARGFAQHFRVCGPAARIFCPLQQDTKRGKVGFQLRNGFVAKVDLEMWVDPANDKRIREKSIKLPPPLVMYTGG